MIKLAWRNLWRNRTRTTIVVVAISLSYAMMLVSMGMGDAAHSKMEEAALRTAGGNILVHGDGYWLEQASDQLIEDPSRVLATAGSIDGVSAVIPRVLILGLMSSPRGSAGVRLSGIDPAAEGQLIDLEQYLAAGTFFDDPAESGAPLLLGAGIVDELVLDLGARVVLTATDRDGEVVRALFHLTGVLETGTDAFDDAMAFTTIVAAQEAVAMGDRLTQIGVLVDDDNARRDVRAALAGALGEGDGLELLTWDEAFPEMVGAIEIDDAFAYIYIVVIFIVVGFGIANTFLMSVLERVRELGLLAAIGLTPSRTVRMVLAEAMWLALLSLAIGFALGYGGHLYLHNVGIDLAELYGMDLEVAGITMDDTFIRSELRAIKWVVGTVGVFVLVVVTSLYPAWRAVRLDPARAMRTYE